MINESQILPSILVVNVLKKKNLLHKRKIYLTFYKTKNIKSIKCTCIKLKEYGFLSLFYQNLAYFCSSGWIVTLIFTKFFKSRKIIGCFTCTNLCHVPPCKFYKTHCFVLTASTRALSFDTLHHLRFLI